MSTSAWFSEFERDEARRQDRLDQIRADIKEREAGDAEAPRENVHARVFVSKEGNRFLIPGYWYADDDPDVGLGSASACIIDGMMIGVVCGFESEEWIDIASGPDGIGEIAHIRYQMTGQQFMHGAIDVLLIGGPLFDEEMAAKTIAPT